MDNNRWWGWAGLIILFLIVQAWRALFRAARGTNGGMARMNAAAERILKERGASAANPIPRTKPAAGKATPAKQHNRNRTGAAKLGASAPLPKSSTPAVIRRTGILSGARDPVIQRRR
jgi:hypothetical protein